MRLDRPTSRDLEGVYEETKECTVREFDFTTKHVKNRSEREEWVTIITIIIHRKLLTNDLRLVIHCV